MARNRLPGVVGEPLLELERRAGKHGRRRIGVHLLQHGAAEHGALDVRGRHGGLQPRRVLGEGELHRLGFQLVALGGRHLHEAVRTHRQIVDRDQAVPVGHQRVVSGHVDPRAISCALLQLERRARQHRPRRVGVHLRQHGLAQHGALRVFSRHGHRVVRRGRRNGELHRFRFHDVARRRFQLDEAVLAQQQPRDRDQAVGVRRQALGSGYRCPRVVGLHLLQLEHRARKHDAGVARIHLRQHGLAVLHFHAARDHREVGAR